MNIFKLTNLPFTGMKFKEWKIEVNSKLSYGDPIFIYEYQINGTTKKERYKSTLNGVTVLSLVSLIADDKLTKNMQLFEYEKCSHPIISYDMCGVCGEDLKTQNEMTRKTTKIPHSNDASASVKIVHAEPRIKVSKNEALEIGKRDLNNLVKQKKLVLLVDLDQTIIHTTNDQVSNQLKEVFHYELLQKNVWYHTKFRPNCTHFLEDMSKLYELHMVTFGERSYAHKIASFMDPDRRLFHDRILSRNELDNPISKTDNLKALFPRGDSMVCIIDDREDVWNYARNLICVQPYFYFKNTGDINDPHKANSSKHTKKRKMIDNLNAYKQSPQLSHLEPEAVETKQRPEEDLNIEENLNNILTDSKSNELTIDNNSVDSTLSTSSNGSSLDSTESGKKKDSTAKKTNKLNDKNKENKSESSSSSENTDQPSEITSETNWASIATENNLFGEHSNNQDDPDDYLDNLHKILTTIHTEYYKIYEKRLQTKSAQTDLDLDETDLPDLKRVIPMLKSRILENVVITFSGVVPTDYDLKKQKCYWMAKALGARVNEHLVLGGDEIETDGYAEDMKKNRNYEYSYDESSSSNTSGGDSKHDSSFSSTSNDSVTLSIKNDEDVTRKIKKSNRYTTHLVAAKFGTSKVHEALKSKRKVHVVTPEWLINCNFKWEKCEEKLFALTKEYEYKNCLFHKEYNMHQKFASTNIVSTTSSNLLINQGVKVTTKLLDMKATDVNRKRQFNEVRTSSLESTVKITSVQADELPGAAKVKRKDSFFTSETFYAEEETKKDQFNMNQDMFDQMDKEVEEELDNEEEDSNSDADDENEDSTNNSESTNNSYDGEDDDDIDDEMVLALERDF